MDARVYRLMKMVFPRKPIKVNARKLRFWSKVRVMRYNLVADQFRCPICYNGEVDKLICREDDTISCADCGHVYTV